MRVDLTQGAQVVLGNGVSPGDQVVIDGQEKLRNGSRVSPRQAAPGQGAQPSAGGQGAIAAGAASIAAGADRAASAARSGHGQGSHTSQGGQGSGRP